MRILITGAGGMLGRKLTTALLTLDSIDGPHGGPIDHIDLVDVVASPIEDPRVTGHVADLADGPILENMAARDPDIVFHLAGVVSGEAEQDFGKGMRVNLDGTRRLFDALRDRPGVPRVVFTSSIAVFGAPFPPSIPDDFHLTPLTSYGMQKAASEMLLADYTRRGFIDGIGLRLPTISVRPGAPNAAASGFFSSIIREPLAGERVVLPVSREVRHTHASPRSAVGFLLHAAALDGDSIGPRRNLTMPGVSVTVGEQIEALVRAAGPDVADLIMDDPDPFVADIVAGWPQRFTTDRADQLGFTSEATFDDIIQTHIDDELSDDQQMRSSNHGP